MEQKYKRKEFYTDTTLQFRFIGVIITLVTIESIIFGASIHFIFEYSNSIVIEHRLVFIYLSILAMLIAMAAVNTYVGIHVTHKMAGPLYKFSLVSTKIARGDLSDFVSLRDNDLLQDFEIDFNEMISGLRRYIAEDKARKQEIMQEVEKIKEKTKGSIDIKNIESSLNKIVEESSKIGDNFVLEEKNEKQNS